MVQRHTISGYVLDATSKELFLRLDYETDTALYRTRTDLHQCDQRFRHRGRYKRNDSDLFTAVAYDWEIKIVQRFFSHFHWNNSI